MKCWIQNKNAWAIDLRSKIQFKFSLYFSKKIFVYSFKLTYFIFEQHCLATILQDAHKTYPHQREKTPMV